MRTRPDVHVIATTIEGARAALDAAIPLARGSHSRLALLVPQVVPYPIPLDGPVDVTAFAARRYQALIREATGDAEIRVGVCRTPEDVVRSLPSESTVVIGGHGGTLLPSAGERLARTLARRGD